MVTYFDTDLLVYTLLPLFYLLLQLFDGGTVWGSTVGLEDLDVPRGTVNTMPS